MSDKPSTKRSSQLENIVSDLRDDFIQTEASKPAKVKKLAEPKTGKEIRMRNPLPKWVPLLVAFFTVVAVFSLLILNREQASDLIASQITGDSAEIDIQTMVENDPEALQAVREPTALPDPPIEESEEVIPDFEYEFVEPPPLPDPPDPTPEPDPEIAP